MIGVRDLFAIHADVSWIRTATHQEIEAKTGLPAPPPPVTIARNAKYRIDAEVRWRWKYADLMLRGN